MFRFAVQRDILEHSPCDGVVMPAPLNRGERVLSADEIKNLWGNLSTAPISPEVQTAIKIILLTGQRPGEVAGMHTKEIDGKWWTIPSERSKNGKAHRVYLTDTVIALIGNADGFVFKHSKLAKRETEPMTRLAISQAANRALAVPVKIKNKPVFDADGNPVTENKLGVSNFVPHDLRRTAATFMSQIGFMDEIIDAVLNHTKQGIIRTYNLNRYDNEKQQALEAWEGKLNTILAGDKVVDLGVERLKRKAA